MVPPDGDRAKRLPMLSWESVVSDPTASPTPEGGSTTTVAEHTSLAESVAPASTPMVPPEPFEPVVFAPLVLDPVPTPADRLSAVSDRIPVVAADLPPIVRTAPPTVIVPLIAEVAASPSPVALHEVPAPDALPPIVEATPVDGVPMASADPGVLGAAPCIPMLPAAPTPAPRPAAVATYESYDVPSAASPPSRSTRRKKSRRGPKLLATFVILGGLVAGGVVIAKPYIFPGDWDAATSPYADAVEAGRGVDFAEPLSVLVEPSAEFTTRLSNEIFGDWTSQLATWRALGLANGPADGPQAAQLLEGWRHARYSTDDGQVYHDGTATAAGLDAQLTQEMAAASLDQEFSWSLGQPTRTLDGAAETSADVLRQSRDVQASSAFNAAVAPVQPAIMSYAPPVLGYRALAPEMFAEFDAPTTGAANALSGLGPDGPGPLVGDAPVLGSSPVMIGADRVAQSPVAMDRSFWYLAFAGYLDARTAYAASEAIVENSSTIADRDSTSCVYATFSGGDVARTDTLSTALQAWAAAAPAEFATGFSVLPDGALQLVTCDPGAGFENGSRLGVARELIAWRSAELATIGQVRASGGTESDIAAAWAVVETSDTPIALVALPADMAPAEFAGAVRDAVAAILTPPAG